jgi:hypothetical protein
MKAGIWNLGIGLVGVAAGASGQFTLPGTGSATWLMVVGGVIALVGLFQLYRSRGQ